MMNFYNLNELAYIQALSNSNVMNVCIEYLLTH